MQKQHITIATRKSLLALWQAHYIKEQLITRWPSLTIDLLELTTSGDKFQKDKLQDIGGKGLFVKELEEALLDNRADIAVHSMKDVPSYFPEGLTLPVICKRHNPTDAFVSNQYHTIRDLPTGAVVGTSSLRRQSQLLRIRPDLVVKTLRGNIHTRINKLDNHDYDAIILATSGLERMSLDNRISERIDTSLFLPACGQGALGIECREKDAAIKELIAPLNDSLSSLCVSTERRVNQALGGTCHTPIAIYCQPKDDHQILLRARVGSEDGQTMIEASHTGLLENAYALANACVNDLELGGAADLLKHPHHE